MKHIAALLNIILFIKVLTNKHHTKPEPINDNSPFITEEFITRLKATAPFKVYDYQNHPFKNKTIAEAKSMLCKIDRFAPGEEPIYYNEPSYEEITKLPEHFDARKNFSDCIHPIRNQGNCGSCWAISATGILSDRLCIASNKTINVTLSPQDPISCDITNMGCDGGYIWRSWKYLKENGTVSLQCYPYISGITGSSENCRFDPENPTCPGKGNYTKYYAESSAALNSTEAAKVQLVNNGPIETGFDVYEDFYYYNGGIYVYTTGYFMGGQSVKIVGFGKDEKMGNYWIAANSWGSEWGEDGYFRIKEGECRFEDELFNKQKVNDANVEMFDFLCPGRDNLKFVLTDNVQKGKMILNTLKQKAQDIPSVNKMVDFFQILFFESQTKQDNNLKAIAKAMKEWVQKGFEENLIEKILFLMNNAIEDSTRKESEQSEECEIKEPRIFINQEQFFIKSNSIMESAVNSSVSSSNENNHMAGDYDKMFKNFAKMLKNFEDELKEQKKVNENLNNEIAKQKRINSNQKKINENQKKINENVENELNKIKIRDFINDLISTIYEVMRSKTEDSSSSWVFMYKKSINLRYVIKGLLALKVSGNQSAHSKSTMTVLSKLLEIQQGKEVDWKTQKNLEYLLLK